MLIKENFLKIKRNIFKNDVAVKIINNTGWMVSDKVFKAFVSIFVTALIARHFGPESFGQFNYALSFVMLFTALSTLGLQTLTIKGIVDKDFEEGTVLFTSFLLRIMGGLILIIMSSLIIRIIEPHDKVLHTLVLLLSFMMLFKSFEVIEYWFQAHQRAKISSIVRMGALIISASLKILLVVLNGTLIMYAFIYLLDIIIIGLLLYISYYNFRLTNSKLSFSFKYAKYVLSQCWYLILSGFMVTLYMQMDQVMLGSMLTTTEELGIYSVAVQISIILYFIPTAVITAFKPVIMGRKKTDENSYLRTVQLSYTIIAWIGIISGILITIFSELVINILFGQDYIKAAGILSISIWAGTFAMLGSARGTWLISEGLQKYSLFYIGAGAVVNITLNYLLIPIYGGYGAAIATLISQIIVAIIAPLFFAQTRKSSIMIMKAFKLEGILKK